MDSQPLEVAAQVEERHPSTPTGDHKNPQSEDATTRDICVAPQQTAPQPNPIRKHTGRGRPPKCAQVSAQRMMSVKEEEECSSANATGFQDDPSDADYSPGKNVFTLCECSQMAYNKY